MCGCLSVEAGGRWHTHSSHPPSAPHKPTTTPPQNKNRQKKQKKQVNGIVYYYPYANYKESRPSRLDLEREAIKIIRGAAKPTTAAENSGGGLR
jgi:hypothetical protein